MFAGRASESRHGDQSGAGRTETETLLLILLRNDFLFLNGMIVMIVVIVAVKIPVLRYFMKILKI